MIDQVWEDLFSTRSWGKYPSEYLIRFIARNFYSVPSRTDVKILELGPGPGANLWFCAREGFSIYGIEGSPTAVNQCLIRLNQEVPGWSGQVVCGDVQEAAFSAAMFDAVIDHECLYCLDYDGALVAIESAHSMLKPRGKIFSRTFASGTIGEGTGEQVSANYWRCNVGPLAGKGAARFTAESDIPKLFPAEKWLVTSTLFALYSIKGGGLLRSG